MLEDILGDRDSHFIMDIDDNLHDAGYFTLYNELNDYGFRQLWEEIDRNIEKFEKKCISLKPLHRVTVAEHTDDDTNNARTDDGDRRELGQIPRARLPTPPRRDNSNRRRFDNRRRQAPSHRYY